jgi:hypothetical protein
MNISLPSSSQMQVILDYVDLIPIEEVDWLLSRPYWAGERRDNLSFWTTTYDRARELIQRLEASFDG